MRQRLIVALLTALAVAHAALVWPSYAVGSFDDDASYLLAARAIGHGATLNTRLLVGLPVAATYPPGYPALLAPLARLGGSSFVSERVLSLVLLVVLLPLTWRLLRNSGVGERTAAAVLAAMALNPVLATYAVMVMAELPFLVVLIGVLLAARRWEETGGRWAGAVTAVGSGALVLLKEAGLGVVAGLVLWLLVRPLVSGWRFRLRWHRPRRAVLVGGVTALLLAPVVGSRLMTGTPLAGARYSSEIGGPASGGVVHRLTAGLPGTLSAYVHQALPDSVVPTTWTGSPFSGTAATVALDIVLAMITLLVLIGAVGWQRRYGGPVLPVVGMYLLETLAFPYTNERRVILVLPLVLAFLVEGAGTLGRRTLLWRLPRFPKLPRLPSLEQRLARTAPARAVVIGVLAAWSVAVLAAQFDRDYLFPEGGHSSQLRGSRYLAMLSAAASPGQVTESDFVWTVALETGLPTSGNVSSLNPLFSPLVTSQCSPTAAQSAVAADDAGFFVSGAFVNAGIGSPCLLTILSGSAQAVRLIRTTADNAAIFELIGSGTVHPGLRELTAGAQVRVGAGPAARRPEPAQAVEDPGDFPVATATPQGTAFTQTWSVARPVSQVSVGAVTPEPSDPSYPDQPGPGVVSRTRVQLDEGGHWVDVDDVPGRIDGYGPRPFLLNHLPAGTTASGVRVIVTGTGTVGVHDLHVLGAG